MIPDRRAGIPGTVRPASAPPKMLRKLFDNGVDRFRPVSAMPNARARRR